MDKKKHILYWEDVNEQLIYAELDDKAWKLPEIFFGYKKQSSFYIYHDQKCAAYYSPTDIKKESAIGCLFYTSLSNINKVIKLKKAVAQKVKKYGLAIKGVNPKKLSDKDLVNCLLNSLDVYHEALSTHYLTQPQFFEKFEKNKKLHEKHKSDLERLAHARLVYTRKAWTKAMHLCKPFFSEYAVRNGITLKQAESMTYEELKSSSINKNLLLQRADRYVLVSKYHVHSILIGSKVDEYIKTYEQYEKIDSVKGIVGNRGIAKGNAFVVSNENLDLKSIPKGMQKGMILIIQNAWPEFEPYYELASAIVTNEGGITSHGVVVARELKIPCIVGAKIATKVIKTNDVVEVNADEGVVKVLKKAKNAQ